MRASEGGVVPAVPQSAPWLRPSEVKPARCLAWCSVRTVYHLISMAGPRTRSPVSSTRSPKITGTPKSNWILMRPLETDSAMCSKWAVSPLISTPMAMMESNGPALAGEELLPGTGVALRARPPSRSPEGAEEACTCEAAKSLKPSPHKVRKPEQVPQILARKNKNKNRQQQSPEE